MKKLVIFVAFVLLSCNAFSQVQIYGRYTLQGEVEPNINIYGTHSINNEFKFTYFTLVEQGWSEGLVGIAYSPAEFIEIGVGAGIEQNPALFRYTASIWLGKGDFSLFLLGEKGDGNDNYWYKSVLSYKASDNCTTGLMAWRYHGVGPFVEINIPALESKIWVNPCYDFEFNKTRIMIGANITM